ncbi:MAG: hypothetical protein KAI24_15095 [Planctomycetes bacterium]|nr:hypothetical protein [Planctomycetota bacterium]
MHGALPAAAARACGDCHSEHHGDERPLLPPIAYRRAGIEDVASYDHEHVAFGLDGVHRQLACVACHHGADDQLPPAGGRFLGLSQDCASCHRDAHDGAFGERCASCHQQRPGGWDAAGILRHDRFALAGAHAAVACAQCHDADGERSVVAEQHASLPVRGCASCHDDPHGTRAISLSDSSDCARCHDTTSFAAARPDAAAHARLGFELIGAHADVGCAGCHGAPGEAPWGGGAAPTPGDCARCHQHPHAAALLATTATANDCGGCHQAGDASFANGRITAEQHRATGFALAAPHDDVACSQCHVGDDHGARFPGRAALDCRACHDDAHGGQFDRQGEPRSCTECHEPHRFRPHRFGVQAHGSVFPLTGAHDGVACVLCHDHTDDGVRRFVGTERSCAACHDDVHGGRFDEAGRPAQVDGRVGCARCHDTGGFLALRGDFDHALWTGHALRGAHRAVGCAACHREPVDGRTLGGAPGRACSDCHVDPHLGQFTADGADATDCRRCHDEGGWRPVRFDHARDSRFALDAAHARLACSACHRVEHLQQRAFVRYKPIGTRCADCHRLGGGR